MALNVLTTAQGGTSAIIKAKCCAYIPEYHKNISQFLTDTNTQIGALNDPSLPFYNWLNSWTKGGFFSTIKRVLFGLLFLFVIPIMFCSFLPCLSTWCQDSFTAITSNGQTILSAQRDSHMLSILDTTALAFPNS